MVPRSNVTGRPPERGCQGSRRGVGEDSSEACIIIGDKENAAVVAAEQISRPSSAVDPTDNAKVKRPHDASA